MTMDDTIDEIPHNMMGIKSESLYMTLESITREHDVSILNANVPSQLLPELIEHLSDTIPNDIFIQRSEVELNSLKRLGDVLRDKFLETGNYPFTMQRICELCFDPFKYFKVNELGKFINALEKCCCVDSYWVLDKEKGESHSDVEMMDVGGANNDNDDDDVSLSRIPWIDKKTEMGLPTFIKEIDTIMNANMGYDDDDDDDDDDEDEDGVGVMENNQDGISIRNDKDFIIEEYYEDDGDMDDDDDDDDDEDDDDYVEDRPNGDGTDPIDDEEEEVAKEEDGLDKTPLKRKPTELDNYQYDESPNEHDLLTPKKYKQDSQVTEVLNSPSMFGEANLSTSVSDVSKESGNENGISVLVSPNPFETSKTGEEQQQQQHPQQKEEQEKIRATTDEILQNNNDSPLSNKTR
ncbi:hypothetical protein NCAS_0A14920 [Naumovozyma castellii]|uniref:Serine/threonine-protein phosphatase 4 regulatory subunit 2 n=1 Tax=Naumovozyma castellii TaxID=27288 RepID=G0V999_NAUCA|nr:hypothetical protein NCAS_0A14920 [Naumovozyma castellii CBS 4309]CCC68050.1 hypothetical protein NCAS_0A14920 [Naumovozyma castellii CBS 4309]